MLHVGSRRFCTDCRWFNDSSNKLAWKLETKVVDPKGKPGVVNYPVIVGPFVPNPHTVYVKLQKNSGSTSPAKDLHSHSELFSTVS